MKLRLLTPGIAASIAASIVAFFAIRYLGFVMRRLLARVPLGVALALIPLSAQRISAQAMSAQNKSTPASIRVHGESLVSVAPDEVEMDIGVISEASTAEAASAQNTIRVNRMVDSLRSLLPAGNIKTINLSINPNFRYPKDGAPVIQGYTANNTVRITLNNLDILSQVISASTKAGASSINRLNFTLRAASERQARAQALGEAAAQAEAGAAALASSLKLNLGRVLRVEEGQPVVVSPAPQIDLGKAQSTDMTPLSPGYIQLHADVNLEYEIISAGRR